MIYIYGGGVVGYSLAAHFEHFNISYKLFTRKETTEGYGLTIQEADNILHFLNLKPDISKINYLNRYVKINFEGRIISSLCHSKGNYVMSRTDLIELFKTKLNKDNIITITENITNLVELDEGVEFNIGDIKYTCDYLIGCDGINSQVRKYINIKDEEILVDTKHSIQFVNIKDTSPFKYICSDVIEYVSVNIASDNRMRIFIKPNGCYGASVQLICPPCLISQYQIERYIPQPLQGHLDFTNSYKNTLYSSNKILPTSNRIILCGDSLHPMIPYHGSGANCGIINTHVLAKLFHNKCLNIADMFYEGIKETYNYVNQSFNTFYKIHCTYDYVSEVNKIYQYDKNYLMVPIPVNYISSNHIVEVKPNLSEIILAGIGLDTFPEQLFNVLNLRVINLNDNKITEIPTNIKLFQELKELYLRNNRISILPDELMHLQNLETLRLSYNNINNIDNLILKNIRELCLTGNNINNIPDNISKCTNLVKFYCSNNEIDKLSNLNSLKKLKYLRIGFNPINYDDICNSIDKIIHMLIELRISISQVNNCIVSPNTSIKYGSTLNKHERKQFEERNMVDKVDIEIEKHKFEIALSDYILDNRLHNKNDTTLDIIIKFNVFNALDIIEKTANTKLEQLFLTKQNLQFMLIMFTLDNSKTITLNDKIRKKLHSLLNIWFNNGIINTVIDNTKTNKYTLDYITHISKLYNKLKLTVDMLTYKEKYPKHIGYPLNPKKGRPMFGDNKCYYKGCKFTVSSAANNLEYHLRTNVNGFIDNFHKFHEQYLPTVNQNKTNGIDMNYKCPVPVCRYKGDMILHMKQLGFAPYWQVGDIFDYSAPDYKVYDSETCMVCIDNSPDVLFDCGHKITCAKCCLKLLETKNMCILCNNKINYYFVC